MKFGLNNKAGETLRPSSPSANSNDGSNSDLNNKEWKVSSPASG